MQTGKTLPKVITAVNYVVPKTESEPSKQTANIVHANVSKTPQNFQQYLEAIIKIPKTSNFLLPFASHFLLALLCQRSRIILGLVAQFLFPATHLFIHLFSSKPPKKELSNLNPPVSFRKQLKLYVVFVVVLFFTWMVLSVFFILGQTLFSSFL